MVKNAAGGYVFDIGDWAHLRRFLVLGIENGTYYASEQSHTIKNAECVRRCLEADPIRTVNEIVAISEAARAPKNDAAVFALAMVAGLANLEGKRAAFAALPRVCRIGTHLFQFAAAVKNFRGYGRMLRDAIGSWYTSKTPRDLAFQVSKYQQREGWSNRDLLRLSHPQTDDPVQQAILRWVVTGMDGLDARTVTSKNGTARTYPSVRENIPRFLLAVEEAKTADTRGIVRLIREDRLPRECIPTQHLNSVEVWEALLEHMPPGAMIRNLGKMSSIGLVAPMSEGARLVIAKLSDTEYLRQARVHPIAILLARHIYDQGHGDKGKLTWNPVRNVCDALDRAFVPAFGNIEPTGTRRLVALDVSASMGGGSVAGTSLTPREAACAMAMVTVRTEPNYYIHGFTTSFVNIPIGATTSLSDAMRITAALPMGGTDCSLPMRHALANRIPVDMFEIYTDNETWAGGTHACQALRAYRDSMGIDARFAVIGMTATSSSIADPSDPKTLDVVGFDTATPQILADFGAGRI